MGAKCPSVDTLPQVFTDLDRARLSSLKAHFGRWSRFRPTIRDMPIRRSHALSWSKFVLGKDERRVREFIGSWKDVPKRRRIIGENIQERA